MAEHKSAQTNVPAEVCRSLDRVEWFIKLALDAFAGKAPSPRRTPAGLVMTVVKEVSCEEEMDSASPTRKTSHALKEIELDRGGSKKKSSHKPRAMLASLVATMAQKQTKSKYYPTSMEMMPIERGGALEYSESGDPSDIRADGTPEGWMLAVERNLGSKKPLKRCFFTDGMAF